MSLRCRERLTFHVPLSTDLTRSHPRVEGGQYEPSFRKYESSRVRGYHQKVVLRILDRSMEFDSPPPNPDGQNEDQ